MGCGDAGHILVSKSLQTCLAQISSWSPSIHDLGGVTVKHGITVHISNAFDEEFGNPRTPSKIVEATVYLTRKKWKRLMAIAAALVVLAGQVLSKPRGRGGIRALLRTRFNSIARALRIFHAGAYFAATKALSHAVQLAHTSASRTRALQNHGSSWRFPRRLERKCWLARREDASVLSPLDRLQLDAIDLSITREFLAAARKYEAMLTLGGAEAGDIYLDLGRSYERSAQQPKRAEDNYLLATKASPQNPAAWLRLAVLHSQESKWAKPRAEFRKAEELYQITSNLEV